MTRTEGLNRRTSYQGHDMKYTYSSRAFAEMVSDCIKQHAGLHEKQECFYAMVFQFRCETVSFTLIKLIVLCVLL